MKNLIQRSDTKQFLKVLLNPLDGSFWEWVNDENSATDFDMNRFAEEFNLWRIIFFSFAINRFTVPPEDI